MKKLVFKDERELEQAIIDHPFKMYLRMGTGLKEKINENGENLWSALDDLVVAMAEIAIYTGIALAHMLMLLFFPIIKARKFIEIRNAIIKHPGQLRMVRKEIRNTHND